MNERFVKLCLPEYRKASADEAKFNVTRLINPYLLGKVEIGKITPNNIVFEENEKGTPLSIFVITGPNSGGKSVYPKFIGIACILGQLGFHVPAREAHLVPFDGIFCHFPTEGPQEESRLVSECRRMREILDDMTGDSLLHMDESFSGTSASKGP